MTIILKLLKKETFCKPKPVKTIRYASLKKKKTIVKASTAINLVEVSFPCHLKGKAMSLPNITFWHQDLGTKLPGRPHRPRP